MDEFKKWGDDLSKNKNTTQLPNMFIKMEQDIEKIYGN